MNDPVMRQLYGELAKHLNRIAKYFKNPKMTLIVRNPPLTDGDVVILNDDPEAAIAALRRFTVHAATADALNYADRLPTNSARPPEPVTIEEARSEGMGVLLGVIDMANAMSVPTGATAQEALFIYSTLMESMAAEYYGEAWSSFVQHVRKAAV